MYYRASLRLLFLAGGIVALAAAMGLSGSRVPLTSVYILCNFALIAFALNSLGTRRFARRLRQLHGSSARRVLIVGTRAQAQPYMAALVRSVESVQVVGYLTSMAGSLSIDGVKVPETIRSVAALVEHLAIDEVMVASLEAPFDSKHLAQICTTRGIIFRSLVSMPTVAVGKYVATVLSEGRFVLSIETVPRQSLQLAAKRLLDLFGSLFGLAICTVAYLALARRIRRETKGDVLFKQTRVGKNGRHFTLFKFRTMYVNAEARLPELLKQNEMKGHIFKLRVDPRVTPLGRILRRFHIDELPQFWNVFLGEMSLVGTRPPTCDEVSKYAPHHRRRLSMTPGITGLWQLCGNGMVSDFEEIVKLDCNYIDNWSIFLDLRILFDTIAHLINGEGW
jgi:exopolysaccharide biosynthesis polyprenyl glycosylphosphotransferase